MSWKITGLSVITFVLAMAVLAVLVQLHLTSKRLDEKLLQADQAASRESQSISEATLAAAQQAAWDAAWARRLASRPVYYYQPLYRPRYHHRRRHHHPPPDDEPVVEEEVVA